MHESKKHTRVSKQLKQVEKQTKTKLESTVGKQTLKQSKQVKQQTLDHLHQSLNQSKKVENTLIREENKHLIQVGNKCLTSQSM